MNRRGHSTTLVASQPGNQNAVKAGVFSAQVLAPRIAEAERLLAALDPDDLIGDLLRTEVARLLVLRDAMDQTLEEDGVRGRGGQPRNMVNLRLRLTTQLLKTAAQLEAQSRHQRQPVGSPQPDRSEPPSADVLDTIAREHQRETIGLITTGEFDPALFLATIVSSDDPAVSVDDQIRARTLLTRWRSTRPALCACFSTRSARDGAEFRGWMDELQESGLPRHESDGRLAEAVRALARGDRLDPPMMYAKTKAAIDAVTRDGLNRASTDAADDQAPTDSVNARLWRAMLAPHPRTPLRQRLKAFDALEKAKAFRHCTWGGPESKLQLREEKFDAALAYIVLLVAGRHYRSAAAAIEFPETYLAVRDAIDVAIRSSRDASSL